MFIALTMLFVCPAQKMVPPQEPYFHPLAEEMRAIEREHHLPTVAALAPIESIDTTQAAEILSYMFRDSPGVVIEAFPQMKCIAIRADANTTADALGLLSYLNEIAGHKRGGFNRFASSVRLSEQEILWAIVRWVRNAEPGTFELRFSGERTKP
jgi:hypothetical protein